MIEHEIVQNIHDKQHRHHLAAAAVVFLAELLLILLVHELLVHLLFLVGVFGRDAAHALLND